MNEFCENHKFEKFEKKLWRFENFYFQKNPGHIKLVIGHVPGGTTWFRLETSCDFMSSIEI